MGNTKNLPNIGKYENLSKYAYSIGKKQNKKSQPTNINATNACKITINNASQI